MSKQNFTLYRIYYGNDIVYVGRTTQPLADRIRGHLFKKPMLRGIDINRVSKIEYSRYESEADMFLYEIYFINTWKPALNRDDKAKDTLTVSLPPVSWEIFTTGLWDKWKEEIASNDSEVERLFGEVTAMEAEVSDLRRKVISGEATKEEYWDCKEAYSKLKTEYRLKNMGKA